jgi:two-component system chemotaxis response regulator CheB
MSLSDHRPTRVLVADDSDFMRMLLSTIIRGSPEFEVAAEARNGYEVIRQVHEANPDIITLDLTMPDLGGLDALAYIMSEAPRPVVVISAHVAGTTQPALQALECGAVEVVAKPAGDTGQDITVLHDRVLAALRAARQVQLNNLGWRPLAQERPPDERVAPQDSAFCAVAIAASTGGPRALTDIIPRLPADLPAAVLIVQHMPAAFTKPFADRLASLSAVSVVEASEGELLRAGCVYIARGGVHMSLERTTDGVVVALEDTPPLWGLRPAADVLFPAVARLFGPASAGIVLTGMGRDGADGLRAVRDVGGWTAVQDAASSVVHGMPKVAAQYADDELPLHRVSEATVMKIAALARRRLR